LDRCQGSVDGNKVWKTVQKGHLKGMSRRESLSSHIPLQTRRKKEGKGRWPYEATKKMCGVGQRDNTKRGRKVNSWGGHGIQEGDFGQGEAQKEPGRGELGEGWERQKWSGFDLAV